jgi:MoxR-like ATPase
VLLEGVPGLGKTMLVRCLSLAIDAVLAHSVTPDMMPADIQGTWVLMENDQGRHELRFRKAR